MSSENPIGAGNQQETKELEKPLDPWWIVGFVDGEGCFSVGIHRNPVNARRNGGWQLTPTFHLYQHEKERQLLTRVAGFFECGRIYSKGPDSNVLTYTVGRRTELESRIVPFFEEYRPLIKGPDFDLWRTIIVSMRRKEHLRPDGFNNVVSLAYAMNANGKQRSRPIEEVLQGSSETIR